jgi:hypothetical protein
MNRRWTPINADQTRAARITGEDVPFTLQVKTRSEGIPGSSASICVNLRFNCGISVQSAILPGGGAVVEDVSKFSPG